LLLLIIAPLPAAFPPWPHSASPKSFFKADVKNLPPLVEPFPLQHEYLEMEDGVK
jgi:hypothetical protein